MMAVVVCMRPAQDQARQNSSINRGGIHKALLLTEKLLAVGCYQKSEGHSLGGGRCMVTGRLPMLQ